MIWESLAARGSLFGKSARRAINDIHRSAWNHWLASLLVSRHKHFWRNTINNLAISLAVGANALHTTAVTAAPLSAPVVPVCNLQNVRMVYNDNGRCWHERGERRVIIGEPRDSYGYAPRERYIQR